MINTKYEELKSLKESLKTVGDKALAKEVLLVAINEYIHELHAQKESMYNSSIVRPEANMIEAELVRVYKLKEEVTGHELTDKEMILIKAVRESGKSMSVILSELTNLYRQTPSHDVFSNALSEIYNLEDKK